MVSLPQYLLFSEAGTVDQPGRWRFILRAEDDTPPVEAEDVDPVARGDRLELLSIVRALEALNQPSRVVLMTASVYVQEGLRYGLEEWSRNDWQWESFGKMVPVKNRDLWERVQRALRFHRIECRSWRIDPAHASASSPHVESSGAPSDRGCPAESDGRSGLGQRLRRLVDRSWPRIALGHKELDRVACL